MLKQHAFGVEFPRVIARQATPQTLTENLLSARSLATEQVAAAVLVPGDSGNRRTFHDALQNEVIAQDDVRLLGRRKDEAQRRGSSGSCKSTKVK
jgi:hypothetical protein